MRAVLTTAAVVLATATAFANGRPPITNGVHFRPGDDHSLYVATTFGLLVSHDDGCSFRWICEQNIGYGGTFDPKYRVAADGTIFATTYAGLQVSRDGGCSFATATADRPLGDPGRLAGTWIDAIDIGPTGEVWVTTAESAKPNNVYRSTDNGATFAPRGMLSPTVWWKSVAVAPSRGKRVYVTGYQVAGTGPGGTQLPPTAHFVFTDDDGDHWTESALAGVQFGTPPQVLVLGVDHGNADIVFMVSLGANPPSGDRLYRSIDGGATWREALAPNAPILELALAKPDNFVLATFGGEVYRSSDGGATFAPIAGAPQLACVGATGGGELFGCAANWQPDYKAVARSGDGANWDKLFRFVELAGPLECPADSKQAQMCSGLWPALQEQFGTTGPTCSAPAPDASPPPKRSGGCALAGDSTGQVGALVVLTAVCGAVALRRARPRRRRAS